MTRENFPHPFHPLNVLAINNNIQSKQVLLYLILFSFVLLIISNVIETIIGIEVPAIIRV